MVADCTIGEGVSGGDFGSAECACWASQYLLEDAQLRRVEDGS